MAWTTGLAEAAYQGFMQPWQERQQYAREDQMQAEQGQRIKQALMGILPQAFPNAAQGLFDSIMQADPRTMGTVAPIVTGQAQYGQQRADRQTDITNERTYTEGQKTAEQQQENEGFFKVLDILDPGMSQRVRANPTARYSPQTQNAILNTLETQRNVQKINADVKAQYPEAPAFQTVQAAVDYLNNRQGIERDTRTLDRQERMFDLRNQPEPEKPMSPYAQKVLSLGQKILAEKGRQGLIESMNAGEMNQYLQYVTEEEDLAIGQMLLGADIDALLAPETQTPKVSITPDDVRGFGNKVFNAAKTFPFGGLNPMQKYPLGEEWAKDESFKQPRRGYTR